ncbi:hypothetical protein KKF38_04780 [Patescibacteria group bacterium]|nr:hypothetical protein [Patescibacteria group bacterium]
MDKKVVASSIESLEYLAGKNLTVAFAHFLLLKKLMRDDASVSFKKLENLFSEKITLEERDNLRRKIDEMFALPEVSDCEPVREEVKLPKKETGTNPEFFPLAEKPKKRQKKEKSQKVKKTGQPKIPQRKPNGCRIGRHQKQCRR